MAKLIIPVYQWIPCSYQMPKGNGEEIPCLVTCREYDIFNGRYGEKKVRIISYSTKNKEWNTKSDIKVEAWMLCPPVYNGYR